ncbi:ubiquitin carboxyl-terminal hydrolase 30-like [Dendronephthya gigantea]|uniref:ubiquitin carboxyl-terminal hydrolase 30-like n=1 Tax=Dendronephthya gigantea TaxID=151771 RepID=UPI00106CB081|nr:ubiquitin carboxyl-terminal hydrolase 30-like [Dendronephthya gigantea]
MDGKIVVALGGCAVLAGIAYILQGGKKTKDSQTESSGVPGLVNLGNTCYLNSVLQAMASVSLFVSWIETCNEKSSQKLGKLTSELSKFMLILSQPCHEQESYDPTSIFTSLYSHGWVISHEQQDAHEMFQVLTSTLAHEEEYALQRTLNSVLLNQDGLAIDDESIVLRSGVKASKVQRKSWSPFAGLFANQLSCKKCLNKYPVKFEVFDTVSLSLSSNFLFANCTLEGLIRNFMCTEMLESSECSACGAGNGANEKTRLLKKLYIGKMPQCLCFHINRTYWQNNGVPYKNDTFVQFSETLNIEQYLYKHMRCATEIPGIVGLWSDQDGRLSKEGVTTQNRLAGNTIYSLVAVIVHLGEAVGRGHYITYRKSNTCWHLVSDEITRCVPLSHVLKSTAYMLFYERTHLSA